MSRIISYPYDNSINAKDAWVGTDEASRKTKQYTAEALAEYLNISGSISIIGQMTYKYGTTPLSGIGTLAVFGGGPDIVAFSAVAKLTLSNQDISKQRVVEFLDLLVGSDILIAEQGAISTFGYYSIDSYAINATDSNYYDLGVTFKSGNGSMRSDRIYEAQNFVLANDATQSPWNTVPDGISYTAANVGIGTTTPGHKLEVIGGNVHFQNTESSNTFLDVRGDDANAYIRAYSGSNSVWLYQGGSSSYLQSQAGSTLRLGSGTSNLVITNTSNEVMRISGSNVGIGTTNPSEALDVAGGIKAQTIFIENASGYNAKLLSDNLTTSKTFFFPDNEGTIALTSDIPAASQWDNVTGGINYAGGNVGIGTTSPLSRLEVLSAANEEGISIKDSSANLKYKVRQFGGNTYSSFWNASNVERVRISSGGNSYFNGGNVGIGTTSPSQKLDVNGNISIAHASGPTASNQISMVGSRASFGYDGSISSAFMRSSDTSKPLVFGSGANEFMRIVSSTGNVGIGTTSPLLKLSVGADGVGLDLPSTGTLGFYTTNSERMRITSTGNVGIGTNSPASKLAVAGGDIEVDGSSSGIILKSPDGTRYRITVANGGTLTVTAV